MYKIQTIEIYFSIYFNFCSRNQYLNINMNRQYIDEKNDSDVLHGLTYIRTV